MTKVGSAPRGRSRLNCGADFKQEPPPRTTFLLVLTVFNEF